ncbi:MAG: hypothetical protein PHH26_04400, partial [Candidatus Thermoplasmatota archaeon]|nr:hypothetical protein [Candidatus Thermoplasmatota archaeon]
AKDAERFGTKWKEDFKGIDAIIITTDDKQFRNLPWGKIAKDMAPQSGACPVRSFGAHKEMRIPVLVDGRNILTPDEMKSAGFAYFGIGRR